MKNFIGKKVTLFLASGTRIYGTVEDSDDKILVLRYNEVDYIIFKEKVEMMALDVDFSNRLEEETPLVREVPETFNKKEKIKYEESGFSLPSSLLSKEYEEEEGDDLSVHFGSNLKQNVTFSLKDSDDK